MNKTILSYAALLLLLVWFMPSAAYGDGGNGLDASFSVEDNIPPAKVTDLAVTNRSDTSLTLTWTAPGDDDHSGTARQYDIRYSTSAIDSEASWEAATVVSHPPSPQAPDSTETFTITGLSRGTRYYFALKTADEVPNWSDLSNSPLGITSSPISHSYKPEYRQFAGQCCLRGKINSSGVITQSITCDSFDGLVTVTIDKGTTALTRYSAPLIWIGIYQVKGVPSPPKLAYITSLMYDLQPTSATFDPPATLAYRYDLGHIPPDIVEEDLVIATYDRSIDEWANFDCVVDTEAKIITAKISHFSPVAIFTYNITSPAIFEYSALDISPSRVSIGEVVTISILAANTGGEPSCGVVTLKINGKVEATKNVTLAAGTSKPISFTTIKNTPGTHSVAVNGLMGSFMVKEKAVAATSPPAEMPPAEIPPAKIPPAEIPPAEITINWPVLWGAIGGVIMVALVILFLVRRKAESRGTLRKSQR